MDNKNNKHPSVLSEKGRDGEDLKDSTPADKPPAPTEQALRPASFTSLFRFSTRFELMLDALGFLGAVGAGASQPLVSLIFGDLTRLFVQFGTVLLRARAGDPEAQAALPTAAAEFRNVAAKDASYLVYLAFAMFFCTYLYMYTWVYTGEVNAKRIRELYLQAVLRQDIQYFDKVGPGEVTTRIQTDTHLVQQGISEKVVLTVSYLSAFVTGYILAYARSWRLALAISAMLPGMGLTGAIMNMVMTRSMRDSLKHVAEGGNQAEEVVSTIRTVQAFGIQQILSNTYSGYVTKALKSDLYGALWSGMGLATFFFIVYSAYALTFSFGTTLINRGQATAGDVITVFMAILIGSFSLAMMAPEIQAISHARGAASKLFVTIDRVPEIDSSNPGGLRPTTVEGNIAFKDVSFSYPSRPTVSVMQNLSITFRAGKTAALVGASGSGKSTIVSLVERFYDPLSGNITLDGNDLKDLNLTWLRSQIGLVSQEPVLFATTIKENVAHGLINTQYENASEEEKFALIKEACVKSNADGFIMKLPGGYDTLVGERGFLLSGGQKQRVAIARAIVSDPRVLLLDEATSALDTQSEGVVQDALDKAAAGRTTITIAHRLSTIRDADTIYVMGDGCVLEQGTHSTLLQFNGAYARLVEAQGLRDSQDVPVDIAETDDVLEKNVHPEHILGRKMTGHSLASEDREDKHHVQGVSTKQSEVHTLFYIFKRFSKVNGDAWKSYLIGCIFAVLAGLVYPAFGIVYTTGVEAFSAIDAHDRRVRGDRSALWLFVIAVLSSICMAIQNYYFGSAAATLTAKLRTLSYRAILRQDVEFFDKETNSTGVLTAGLSENPQKVNGLAGVTLGAIVQNISTVTAATIVGLAYGWKLALVSTACTPFLVSGGYIRLRIVILKDQVNKRAHEQSAQLACEAAASIRTVAALTRERDCCAQYSNSLAGPLAKSNRTAVYSHMLFAFSQGASFLVMAVVFWYGSILVASQEYSTFQFFVCLMSTTFSAIQAGNLFLFVPDMSAAKGAGSSMIQLLDSIPEIDAESSAGKAVDRFAVKGQVRFDNLHFRYPTRPAVRVLKGFSLQVEPGSYVALVGASGCGKSTIIQLLERFYDPLAGGVYLDGELISELNVQEYRKQLALVSQEPTLYSGTVRFNILLGAIKPLAEVTQEEIENACRDANILDFINSLPQGFDTEVGGKGSQLSGGQKQRIAIARALIRNPKVLLLDEATSALDSTSEKVVQQALDHAAKGRTTIAIAHRLSTIQNADKIYFIKDGRVCESGTHDQLLSRKGEYFEFVQLQGLSQRE